jgi:hypothetical protein
MTVAVAFNAAEGVILGADSAITLNDTNGAVVKTYENATKIFQLGDKPIGLATFGLGSLGNRIIGSYIREFERKDPGGVVSGKATMEDTVEELRNFFYQQYQNTVVLQLEEQHKKKFFEIPLDKRPILGFALGGFSTDAYLSEVWHIVIPQNEKPKSSTLMTGPGDFRPSWYSLCEPIIRYHNGVDRGALNDLLSYFRKLRGAQLSEVENNELTAILKKYEYQIPFGAMPLGEAIAYVKFLVEMVIYHYRFAVGAPIVGGKVQLGLVSYRGKKFRILSSDEISFDIPEGEINETT